MRAQQKQTFGLILIAALMLIFILARYWKAVNFHIR
jgi:hypothetical protein